MEARQEACLRTLYTAFRRGFSCLPGANLPVIERIWVIFRCQEAEAHPCFVVVQLVGVKRRRSRWLDPRSSRADRHGGRPFRRHLVISFWNKPSSQTQGPEYPPQSQIDIGSTPLSSHGTKRTSEALLSCTLWVAFGTNPQDEALPFGKILTHP
ncbi:predicted protein [Coccidioides posadasii str. Silveira]|uniref:Predicted protein n=2 Tax=Coccidioides posadasii TaxID=199306 RepID=E9DHZ9_COCPS|nr:predicted protein [Coccidioides posadasii str. Silveira]KMM69550.1 hypothetical protein CPAG_05865 [Coccidioides posadasii RMSCC 3488]